MTKPDKNLTLPLAEERVSLAQEVRQTGRVRVSTKARRREVPVEFDAEFTTVTVERIARDVWLDSPVEPRVDGDVTIIPVVEEVPVIVTRLRLVEEIRLTRRRTTRRLRERVTVRRIEATVERLPAGSEPTPPEENPERHGEPT